MPGGVLQTAFLSLYSTYTLWEDDLYCEEYSVAFSTEKKLPLIALASYPRSGNTWVRYLIHGAVGIFTGSFYNSGCIASQGKILIKFEIYLVQLINVIIKHIE